MSIVENGDSSRTLDEDYVFYEEMIRLKRDSLRTEKQLTINKYRWVYPGDYLAAERASSQLSESRPAKIWANPISKTRVKHGKLGRAPKALFCEESGDKRCRRLEPCTRRDRAECSDPTRRLERGIVR